MFDTISTTNNKLHAIAKTTINSKKMGDRWSKMIKVERATPIV